MRGATYRVAAAAFAILVSLMFAAGAVASCPSPTHSLSLVKIGTASGNEPYRATFGPYWPHIVKTPNGLFAIYKYESGIAGGDNATTGYWKLMRSTNGGSTWTTVYTDSSSNDGQVENIGIDADSSANVYVVASTLQSGSGPTSPTFFYRFPASNYGTHTLTRLSYNGTTIGTSSKIAMVYNPVYGNVDVMFWWMSNHAQFFEVNPSTGAVTKQVQLWANTQPDNIAAEYPSLELGPNGQIFAGWHTQDNNLWNNGSGTQNYYDAHFLVSSDNGQTWDGPAGQVTLPINDTNTGPSYEIVNTNDPTEFIPYTSSSYKGNYNVLDSFAYNNGALHFFFQGPLPVNHASYAQLAWPGSAFSNRTDSFGTTDGHLIPPQSDGAFTQANNTFTGPLYFLGQTNAASGYRKLIAMDTPDNGASWCTYATSSWTAPTGDISYIGAARFEASGNVTGIFTDQTSSTAATVYFVTSG